MSASLLSAGLLTAVLLPGGVFGALVSPAAAQARGEAADALRAGDPRPLRPRDPATALARPDPAPLSQPAELAAGTPAGYVLRMGGTVDPEVAANRLRETFPGLQVVRQLPLINGLEVRLPDVAPARRAVMADWLASHEDVAEAEANAAFLSGGNFLEADGPGNAAFEQLLAVEAAGATAAEPLLVAIIGTGLDAGHPAVAPHLASAGGVDLYDGDADPSPGLVGACDPGRQAGFEREATHAAGSLIAAAERLAGAAALHGRYRILPIRVAGGNCGESTTATVIAGLQHALAESARLILLDMLPPDRGSAALAEALTWAEARDALIVMPAGTAAVDPSPADMPPAHMPGVLAVTAAGPDGTLLAAAAGADLRAPGYDVLGPVPMPPAEGGEDSAPESGWAYRSGNGAAASMAAGVALAVWLDRPGLTAIALGDLLRGPGGATEGSGPAAEAPPLLALTTFRDPGPAVVAAIHQFIVSGSAELTADALHTALAGLGTNPSVRAFSMGGGQAPLFQVSLRSEQPGEALMSTLRAVPGVAIVEPDGPVRIQPVQ